MFRPTDVKLPDFGTICSEIQPFTPFSYLTLIIFSILENKFR